MYFVYIIKSDLDSRFYYGSTDQDVLDRLKDHNAGKSQYTSKYRPWKLVWFAGFHSREKAEEFEQYLKTGSGHAFSRKRLL